MQSQACKSYCAYCGLWLASWTGLESGLNYGLGVMDAFSKPCMQHYGALWSHVVIMESCCKIKFEVQTCSDIISMVYQTMPYNYYIIIAGPWVHLTIGYNPIIMHSQVHGHVRMHCTKLFNFHFSPIVPGYEPMI